jgi:glycerophosphoryl diester phosphodiesterase
MHPLLPALGIALLAFALPSQATPTSMQANQARLAHPDGGLIVVAHRGCHNPAPGHGFAGHAPENSLAGLQRCIAIGADMMETDVRKAADGTLVMFHDDTVDRTTDGHGKVADLTWADLSKLRLKDDEGQPDMALTDLHPLSLAQILAAAKGRIMLNLDVKAAVYVETVDAVRRAGMERQVVVKTEVGLDSSPVAAMSPFDHVNFMPILMNAHGDADLAAIATKQGEGGARPVAFELPRMQAAQLAPVVVAARRLHVRLFVNTLWQGFVAGYGGDADAVANPDAVWGRLFREGVSIIQTDEPEALLRYRDSLEGAAHAG